MAGSVNKATILGHLGKDPEIRSLASGNRCANFTVATSESWRDKHTGEKKEKTEWHRITVWNENLVELVEKYVRRGDKIYLEGAIETRKWSDQQGVERYTTEIVIKAFNGSITLIGGGDRSSGSNRGGGREDGYGGGGGGRSGPRHELDDDIPFVSCDPADEPCVAAMWRPIL